MRIHSITDCRFNAIRGVGWSVCVVMIVGSCTIQPASAGLIVVQPSESSVSVSLPAASWLDGCGIPASKAESSGSKRLATEPLPLPLAPSIAVVVFGFDPGFGNSQGGSMSGNGNSSHFGSSAGQAAASAENFKLSDHLLATRLSSQQSWFVPDAPRSGLLRPPQVFTLLS